MLSANHFWTPDNDHGYGIPNFYNAYLLLKTNYNNKVLRIADDVVVHPNPFTNELNISLFNYLNGTHRIELFDMLGRKVYSQEIFIRDNTFEILKPSVQTLSPGKYILVLDGKRDFTHLLIKAK
jgi:serine protease AprX